MDKRINVVLTASAAGVVRSFSASQTAVMQFARDSEAAMSRATAASKRYESSIQGVESNVGASLASLRRTATAAVGGFSLMAGINTADNWGQYASRIRQATKSTEEYDHVQARLVVSARNTFRAVSEAREGFIQTSPVLRDMGLSLDQSIDAVDTFSGLLVVNSASAEKGGRAMDAFSKSLNSGKTDADSWSSIMSAMPSIVDLLVASTGRSASEIRKLGVEGKLSVRELVQALVSGNAKVSDEVKKMPTTVKDALGGMSDAFGEYLGKQNEAKGVTATMASSINVLTGNFELLADAAVVAAGVGLVRYSGGMLVAGTQTAWATAQSKSKAAADLSLAQSQAVQTKASLTQAQAMVGLGITQAELTLRTQAHDASLKKLAATQAAYAASGRSILGIMGGPAGLAVTAGLAALAFFDFSKSAEKSKTSLLDFSKPLKDVVGDFEKLTKAQKEAALVDAVKDKEEKARALNDAYGELISSMHSVNGFRSNWGQEQWIAWRAEVNAARLAGEDLLPLLQRAREESGINPKKIQDWISLNGVVDTAKIAFDNAAQSTSVLDRLLRSVGEAAGIAGSGLAALTADQYETKRTEWLGKYATSAEKLTAKLAEAKEEFGGLIPPDVEKRIRDSFLPKGGGASAKQFEEGARYVKQMQERIALIGKETELEKLQAQISVGAIKFKTQAQRKAAEEAASAADAANVAERLTGMSREIAMVGLLSEADKMRYEVSRGLYTGLSADIKETLVAKATELDLSQQQLSFNKTLLDLQGERNLAERQFFREIEAFGRGDQYRGLLDSLAAVEDRYQQIMRDMRNSPGGLSSGQQEAIEKQRDAELVRERERYAERVVLQADWVSGATRGLENYYDTARNTAEGIGSLFSNSFSNMEDVFAKAARGIKVSASDLIDSLIADSMRLAVRQSITGPLASALGGAIGSAFGSMQSNWSSTNTSNPWSLQSLGITGHSDGGYTGDGGRYDPAGIVHKGEGVLNQDEIRALGGERGFNALRRAIRGPGHALGGMAGNPSLPGASWGGQLQLNVSIQGAEGQPEVSARRSQSGGIDLDVIFKKLESRMAGNVAAGSGGLSRAIERRYALTPQLG